MITRPSARAPRTTRFTSGASRAHARRLQIYPAIRPRVARQADLRIRSPLPRYAGAKTMSYVLMLIYRRSAVRKSPGRYQTRRPRISAAKAYRQIHRCFWKLHGAPLIRDSRPTNFNASRSMSWHYRVRQLCRIDHMQSLAPNGTTCRGSIVDVSHRSRPYFSSRRVVL
jgi:hypothetical protein